MKLYTYQTFIPINLYTYNVNFDFPTNLIQKFRRYIIC